eukprot:1161648-Pelagomonas_calceolata.AAC.5
MVMDLLSSSTEQNLQVFLWHSNKGNLTLPLKCILPLPEFEANPKSDAHEEPPLCRTHPGHLKFARPLWKRKTT